MSVDSIIKTYSALGDELLNISNNFESNSFATLINSALAQNLWFTKDSIKTSFKAIGESLHKDKLAKWLSSYNVSLNKQPKTVGIIMAGNIPLVGFHDLLCTLVSGNNVLAKLSSKDQFLYSIIKNILVKIDVSFNSKIEFTDGLLKNIDAIIATGSDNSARYFEYYFSKYPHIIRKNRNSLAILTGEETSVELQKLGNDIFTYFGLGCRNVSLLLVPEGYNFEKILNVNEKFSFVANHTKYFNNYEYQKAIMLMNQVHFYDNGFVLLKEGNSMASPIGVVNYQYYKSEIEFNNYIISNKHKTQCIVSKTKYSFNTYEFGEAQLPELWDYADNVDTLDFLLKLTS